MTDKSQEGRELLSSETAKLIVAMFPKLELPRALATALVEIAEGRAAIIPADRLSKLSQEKGEAVPKLLIDKEWLRQRIIKDSDVDVEAGPSIDPVESRFYVDHCVIHDRATGKHITGDDAFGADVVAESLATLNSLAATPPATLEGTGAEGDSIPMPQNEDQAALMALLGVKWLRTNAPHRLCSAALAVPEGLDAYDAGLLNDHGGGNVEWWQDYIRSELARAHDFYNDQFCNALLASNSAPVAVGDGGEVLTPNVLPQWLLDLIGQYGEASRADVSETMRLHLWSRLITGIKRYAAPTKDPQEAAQVPIPPDVYWGAAGGNFYSRAGKGMGWEFYQKWHKRIGEFPRSEGFGLPVDWIASSPPPPGASGEG